MELNTLLLDEDKRKGIIVPVPHGDGATLTIAPANSTAYDNKLTELLLAHHAAGGKLDASDRESMDSIERQAVAAAVLIGWTGLQKDGEDFPYSPENAEFLLANAPTIARTVKNESIKFYSFTVAARLEGEEALRRFPTVASDVGGESPVPS